ncbi:glycoside hydrolase family 36 protein [Haliangium sp.]|uniref:glycoside hydrolase family 36 protein n=1 Tax=Haliangium sp. TaxID=2663208 RepID=UPI003D0B7EB1
MAPAIAWDPDLRHFVLAGLFSAPVPFAAAVLASAHGRERRLHSASAGVTLAPDPDRAGWQLDYHDLRLQLWWTAPDDDAVLIHTRVLNHGRDPVTVSRLWPALFGRGLLYARDPDGVRVYRNGFQSWSPAGSVPGTSVQRYPRLELFEHLNHHVDAPDWGRRDGLISFLFTVLQRGTDHAGLFGFLSQHTGLGSFFFQGRGHGHLSCTLDYGHKHLAPGQAIRGEPLLIRRGPVGAVLERYAAEVAAAMQARVPARSPVGWCSWYELYTRVRAKDVRANTRALDEHPELGVEYVQLDDGYQAATGDWLRPNRKFPGGLDAVARDIRARGFTPGIWTAPFFAARRSRLFRDHPDWFLTDPRGRPLLATLHPLWRARLYALDLSHPEVLDWLYETFTRLCAAGFDYFKIDFLFAGIRTGGRRDPALSPVEAYRRGLGAIRRAIGNQRYLLACGAPLGPSIGLVDGMRVSADVRESWHHRAWAALARGTDIPSLRDSLRNNLTRAFMHRVWWRNDPDCLLIRERRTALTDKEIELMVTVLGMTGGAIFLSDDLAAIRPERLDLAAAILPPTPGGGLPTDLMARDLPESFELRGPRGRVVALINAQDQERRLVAEVDPGHEHIFDFWRGRVLDDATHTVPAHGVRALVVTPRTGEPTLIGTSLHLTAVVDGLIRAHYDPERGLLELAGQGLARRRGRLWIALPPGVNAHPIAAAEPPTTPADPASAAAHGPTSNPASSAATVRSLTPWPGGVIVELETEPAWHLALSCR